MEQRELEQLAKKQHWTVATEGKGLLWTSPTGEKVQSASGVNGAEVLNLRSRLRRAGLEIPGLKRVAVVGKTDDVQSVSRALDAAIQMIEELADQFAHFRKAQTDATITFRGQLQALEKVTGEHTQAMEMLRDDVENQVAADPIAEFRKRLA